jgi:hypothetical protein
VFVIDVAAGAQHRKQLEDAMSCVASEKTLCEKAFRFKKTETGEVLTLEGIKQVRRHVS